MFSDKLPPAGVIQRQGSDQRRTNAVWIRDVFQIITFVADATVIVRPFAVFLQVVRHVRSTQELATNFARDLVLMAGEVWPQAISCGEWGVTDLWGGGRRKKKKKIPVDSTFIKDNL